MPFPPPPGTTNPFVPFTAAHFNAASTASLLAVVVLLCLPPLHARVRAGVRPLVVRQVAAGMVLVHWLQSHRSPQLTAAFSAASATVGTPFYVVVLPLMQWLGDTRLGVRLALALAASLYVGNGLKDLVCAPRPFAYSSNVGDGPLVGAGRPGARTRTAMRRSASAPTAAHLLAGSAESASAQEHGFPSTHVMNTVVMASTALLFAASRGLVPAQAVPWLWSAAILWTAVVAAARVYLGMHAPIDVLGGAAAGALVVAAWTALDDAYEAFLTSGVWWAVPVQVLGSALLLRLHPRPLRHTPSYADTVTFAGACSGVAFGVWHSRGAYLEANAGLPSLASAGGAGLAACRVLVGFAVVAAVKEVAKAGVLLALPPLYRAVPLGVRRLWQPPLHSLTADAKYARLGIPLDAAGRPWDVSVTARFFSYAALGWAVSELAFLCFGVLEGRRG